MKTLIISLCFLLVASATSAQTAFPSGPEFPAVHDAPFELPGGAQHQPAVAFDGTNYLVVWVDSRGDKDAIMGARISSSGEVLDPVGFVISDPVTDALVTAPDVAWNGESFLVVWEYSFFTMVGRRVSPDGELIDPTVRTFFTEGFVTPRVTSNGDSFLVVDGGDFLRAGLMNRNGEFRPLDAASFAGLRGRTASVASDGSDYVIAVSGNGGGGIFAVPVAADGSVGMRQTVPADLMNSAISTHIVWTGTSYLATWINRSRGEANELRDSTWGHYISPSGEAEGSAFLIHDALAGSYRYDACATGEKAVIAWNLFTFEQSDPRLFFATVDGVTVSDRAAVDADRLSPSGIALACAGGEPFLFWSSTTPTTRELYFRPLGSPVEDAISVTQSVPRQTHTASLTTSHASLLLWQEETGRSSQVRVGTVGSSGSVARGSERAVAPSTVSQRYPRGATDGTNVLVVWTEEEPRFSRRLFGARVGLRGERLDTEPFLISEGVAGEGFFPDPENPPAIVWNGEFYLAAWADAENRIRISRITRDGIVLDPGGVRVMEPARGTEQGFPAMAVTDDGMTLLTWQDGRRPFICPVLCGPPPPQARVVGALIARSGTVASSAEIEISRERVAIEPAVAWNGHHVLVIWKGVGIEGVRLTAEGQPASASGDAILTLAEHRQSTNALTLIANGERFIAAWSETRRGRWEVLINGRIFASSIDREGVVSGPAPVSPGIGNDRRPTILRTSAGGILFYYDRSVPDSPWLEVRRIFGTGTTGFQVRRRTAR